jgi:anti-sigma B factor antagonist
MDLSIETEKVGNVVVLHVAGEVDVFTAPQLREALVGAIEEGSRNVVVDLQAWTSSTPPAWGCWSLA